VCATNRNLQHEVRAGRFREDLYSRLAVVRIRLPPLRERTDDVPLLALKLLPQLAEQMGKPMPTLTAEAMNLLVRHPWPGNVRQLANAVQFALIKCRGGALQPRHLPPEILESAPKRQRKSAGRPAKLTPAEVDSALRRHGGNRARAARELGVARSTLYRYLEELDQH
jgi:DNA-binding NtrC family response regulator